MQHKKTVLLSVVGTSPAVLTETIWALYREKPEYLPDEVIALSTTEGIDKLKKALETPTTEGNTVWSDLKRAVGREKMRKDIRVFKDPDKEQELPDIITSHDQELVADLLLKEVRALKNPMLEECRIVASIAGGRKSMSALMYAVMSLAGDSGDIITHVLAPEAVTKCPDFFYPGQVKQNLVNMAGEPITAKEVQVELAQIPFVPLSGLLKKDMLQTGAGTFASLVQRARQDVVALDTEMTLYSNDYSVKIDDAAPLKLGAGPFLLLAMAARSRQADFECASPQNADVHSPRYAHNLFHKLIKEKLYRMPDEPTSHVKELIDWMKDSTNQAFPYAYTRIKNRLKDKLVNGGFQTVAADLIGDGRLKFERITKVRFAASSAPVQAP